MSKRHLSNGLIKNLDSTDLEMLAKGEQIGVTVRKGRGFSHVTLIARNCG